MCKYLEICGGHVLEISIWLPDIMDIATFISFSHCIVCCYLQTVHIEVLSAGVYRRKIMVPEL